MGVEVRRKLDDFQKDNPTNEVVVPDFGTKVFGDGESDAFELEKSDQSSAVADLILALNEEEEDPDIEVFPADLWRSELEAFRILLKKQVEHAERAFLQDSSTLQSAKLEFEKAKYSYYLHIVLDEFAPLYNKYSDLLKSGMGSLADGRSLADLESEMENLYSLALERDSESREIVMKMAKKILSLEKRIEEERRNSSTSNLSLLQNIEELENKIRDLSETNARLHDLKQARVLISENDGDRLLSGDFSETGVLKKELNTARNEIAKLKEKLSGFELQLALFDKASRLSAKEFSELSERAEKGDRAVKKLNEELANFEQTFSDYVRLQADYNAIRDQLENLMEENEALKEQVSQKDLEISSFRQFGTAGVSQEEYVALQNERRELNFKCADQVRQIQNLSAQLSELEKVAISQIPRMILDLGDRVRSVGVGVEKIQKAILSDDLNGTPTAGVAAFTEED